MTINYTSIISIIFFSIIAIFYVLNFPRRLKRFDKRKETLMDVLLIKK